MVRLSLFSLLLLVPAILAKECGLRPTRGKIVNGDDAYENEFPWQVSWRDWSPITNDYEHLCGASIISDDWLITAAHCVDLTENVAEIKPKNFQAVLGAYKQSEPSVNQKTMEIEEIIVHPLWNSTELLNDIALVKLKQPIGLETSALNAICLGSPNDTFEGGPGIISGWGNTDPDDYTPSDVLQQVELTIERHAYCKWAYRYFKMITDAHVCAGKKTSTCYGDSGGPLQYQKNGRFYLAGVTSWGFGCASPIFPSVFARVPYFLDFITNTTGINVTMDSTSEPTTSKAFVFHSSSTQLFIALFALFCWNI